MVRITFDCGGVPQTVLCEPGRSIMSVAVAHKIPGIEAACGGSMVCGTCHAYIDVQFLGLLPPMSETEQEMIEYGVDPAPNSRLTCQIPVSTALDGLIVKVPASQR